MVIKNFKNYVVLLAMIISSLFYFCANRPTEKIEENKQMPKLKIEQVQKKHQDRIMDLPGVVGIGIGAVNGEPVIKVLAKKKTKELKQQIPKTLDGYTVYIEETGEIRAF